MQTLLLLGAGFSRNWGGPLADEVMDSLLGYPEISRDPELKKILWENSASGFESALEQIQRDFAHDPTSEAMRNRVDAMQAAVVRVFAEMNDAFFVRN